MIEQTRRLIERLPHLQMPESPGCQPDSRGNRLSASLIAALAAAALALLVFAPSASAAELVICADGSDPESCTAPTGVAADRDAQLLYVADNGNQEVDAFEADGTHVDTLALGVSLGAIAVDNDLASPAHGDVYVFDTTNNRVQKLRLNAGALEVIDPAIGEGLFDSQPKLALGPGGLIHVADNLGDGDRRVQKFDHEGNPVESCDSTEAGRLPGKLPPFPPFPGEHGGNLLGLAVDSVGDFYLSNDFGAGVRKYDAACTLLGPVHTFAGNTSFSNVNLAVDADDNLFVRDVSGVAVGGRTAIYAYTPAGSLFRVLYGKGFLLDSAASIAPLGGGVDDDLVVAEGFGPRRVVRYGFEPPGPVVNPFAEFTEADPISNTSATLNTRINPEGSPTDYHFQYVTEAAYQADIGDGGDGFAEAEESAATALVPGSTPNFAPELFRLSDGQAEIGCTEPTQEKIDAGECLRPETTYRFRAVAVNADAAEPIPGPTATFTTREPFEIEETWSTEVGLDAARLHAQVNPLDIPTTGRFEYVTEADYLADVGNGGDGFEGLGTQTSTELDFGSGADPVVRSADLSGLSPDTAYRYRVVVENLLGSDDVGPERTFMTFPLAMPNTDCPNQAFRSGPSAHLPDCRAYEMVSPIDKAGGDIRLLGTDSKDQAAATVPASGRGITFSTWRAFGEVDSAPLVSQYLAGRTEGGWQTAAITPPRQAGIPFGGIALLNPYTAFSQDLRHGWLRSTGEPPLTEDAIEGFSNAYRRDNAAGAFEALCPVEPPQREPNDFQPVVESASADGEVAIIRAKDKLTPNAAATSFSQLYACRDGDLQLASVMPGGAANSGNSAVGTILGTQADTQASIDNALAADGERLYWTDTGTSADGAGPIYLRERPFGSGSECSGPEAPCTRPVSEAVGGAGSDAPARYLTASDDGSRALFLFDSASGSHPLDGNLYAFDAEAESDPTELIASGVRGLAGASADARRIYLASEEVLAPGATAGEANLYLHDADAGEFTFIATLALVDSANVFDSDPSSGRHSRVAADGGALAFHTSEPLTGYDNAEAATGEATRQVFLYDAEAGGGAGELHCVSCNPTGARPHGRNTGGELQQVWVAASLPFSLRSNYAPRALSDDGRRLFFESSDALLPADTNGTFDVYQWQAAGSGDCETGAANHFAGNGGCLDLISPGTAAVDAEFVDASADGSDVFIRTAQSLLAQDHELVDIYDARVGGGFPAPEPVPPPCEGEACKGASPATPPLAGAGSLAFEGPGNPGPTAADICGPASASAQRARKAAKALRARAAALRKAARRARAPRRAKALRARASRSALAARKRARAARRGAARAKRCRARAGAARRAER